MIAFRIKLNGRKLSTAGLPGYHVVSAIATSVLRRPDVPGKVRRRRAAEPELKFELGGLWTSTRRREPSNKALQSAECIGLLAPSCIRR